MRWEEGESDGRVGGERGGKEGWEGPSLLSECSVYLSQLRARGTCLCVYSGAYAEGWRAGYGLAAMCQLRVLFLVVACCCSPRLKTRPLHACIVWGSGSL
jgi:hypothetical protein